MLLLMKSCGIDIMWSVCVCVCGLCMPLGNFFWIGSLTADIFNLRSTLLRELVLSAPLFS